MSRNFNLKFDWTGVSRAPAALTINSTTVYPCVRYNGGVGVSADNWEFWPYTPKFPPGFYNSTLALGGSGDAPTLNQETPFIGGNDDSVLFNGDKYYQATNDHLGNLGTDDIFVEIVFKYGGTPASYQYLFAKQDPAVGGYYLLLSSDDGKLNFIIFNGGSGTGPESEALTLRCWYHLCVAINRDENSTNGSQIYVNGTASGAGVNVSTTSATLDSTHQFTLGAHSTGTLGFENNISYLSIWRAPSWFAAGAAGPTSWAAAASERFWKMTGVWPEQAGGTSRPLLCQRDSIASIEKFDRDGVKRNYSVGVNWPRVIQRKDSTGNIRTGYISEPTDTNEHAASEDLTVAITASGTTRTQNQGVTPWRANVFNRFVETGAAGWHGWYRGGYLSISQNDWITLSMFLKRGAASGYRRYASCTLYASGWGSQTYVYIDLADGTVTASGSSDPGNMPLRDYWVEDWGDNVYRLGVVTEMLHPTPVGMGFASWFSDDGTFAGSSYLGDPVTYPNGCLASGVVQTVNNNRRMYPTYIPTGLSGVYVTETKEPDELRYKADDGNIGGVGSDQQMTLVADVLGDDVAFKVENENFIELNRDTSAINRTFIACRTTDYKLQYSWNKHGVGATAPTPNNALNDNVWNEVRGCVRAKDYNGIEAKSEIAAKTVVAGVSSGLDTTDVICPYGLRYMNIGHDRNIENSSNYTLIANIYIYNHYLPTDGGSRARSTESERSVADGVRAIETMKYAESSAAGEPDTYVLYHEDRVIIFDNVVKD